jgi:catalase
MMDTLSLLKRNPVQVVAIGLVVAIVIGVFAYVAGYLTPRRLSASRIVEAMEAAGGGPHAGFRRAHAKGICIAGTFLATPGARSLSSAAVFAGLPVRVTGRFNESPPDPYGADAAASIRGTVDPHDATALGSNCWAAQFAAPGGAIGFFLRF